MWMVKDGACLYLDRNGNGDLTEPNEKVAPKYSGSNYYDTGQITERNGTVHQSMTLWTNGTEFTLRLDQGNRRGQFVGIGRMERPSWGTKPDNAPIIHFNGPLSLERYGPVYTLPRMQGNSTARVYKLRLMVGTPGLGKGTFASYDDICSNDLGPIQADIEYAPSRAGQRPIQQRVELLHDG
jgi:hypothetical protein